MGVIIAGPITGYDNIEELASGTLDRVDIGPGRSGSVEAPFDIFASRFTVPVSFGATQQPSDLGIEFWREAPASSSDQFSFLLFRPGADPDGDWEIDDTIRLYPTGDYAGSNDSPGIGEENKVNLVVATSEVPDGATLRGQFSTSLVDGPHTEVDPMARATPTNHVVLDPRFDADWVDDPVAGTTYHTFGYWTWSEPSTFGYRIYQLWNDTGTPPDDRVKDCPIRPPWPYPDPSLDAHPGDVGTIRRSNPGPPRTAAPAR